VLKNNNVVQLNSKIHLSGMEFYAYHGCFQEERQVGSYFKVDLILEYNALKAIETDNIDLAINYQIVYSEIEKIMKNPVNLIETLCQKILSILKEKYPQVIHAEAIVYKMNPTLGGKIKFVSVSGYY